jgi:hypothetical protein
MGLEIVAGCPQAWMWGRAWGKIAAKYSACRPLCERHHYPPSYFSSLLFSFCSICIHLKESDGSHILYRHNADNAC